jgi:hypothetical protein
LAGEAPGCAFFFLGLRNGIFKFKLGFPLGSHLTVPSYNFFEAQEGLDPSKTDFDKP